MNIDLLMSIFEGEHIFEGDQPSPLGHLRRDSSLERLREHDAQIGLGVEADASN
jgi:hypothetical protein